eukprot:Hpha_TRINITY_DN12637_c0_g1::TRINITY_DN12637_c0_g1_i1::g.49716::m.49716
MAQSPEEYLMQKGVPTLIDEAVQALLSERPSDAVNFFAQHFGGRANMDELDPATRKLVRDVGGSCTFYLGYNVASRSEEERARAVDAFVAAMKDASTFGFFANKKATGGQVYNSAALHVKKMVPHHKRLATCFLEQLGRDPVPATTTSDRRDAPDTVYHVPELRLPQRLRDRTDHGSKVIISAAQVERVSERARSAGCRDEVYERHCGDGVGPTAEDIYGPLEFLITVGELKQLENSTRLATGPGLPPRFVTELCKRTTHKEAIWFFSLCRSIPLCECGQESRWRQLAALYEERLQLEATKVEELARTRMEISQRIERGEDIGKPPEDELGNCDWDTHQRLLWRDNSAAHLQYLGRKDEMHQVSKGFCQWLDHVVETYAEYGFRSREEAADTVSQSLTELCTSVCVSQQGYFFVDGSGGSANQICEKPAQSITFISAAGLDFNTPTTTIVEAAKYFRRDAPEGTPSFQGFHGFLPGGEDRLMLRVKELYRVIFASCKHHGVRNPSMLPMGLGVFLKNIHPDDEDAVKAAYFRAQWQLLSEHDWGFECYWVNPAQHGAIGKRTLEEGLAPGGECNRPREGKFLRCSVAFHNRDVKFLAQELAKRSLHPAVLNPSDCAAVMLGLMGYYWESGRATYYVGEEDFATTGTGLLAHSGVSEFMSEEARVLHCSVPLTLN